MGRPKIDNCREQRISVRINEQESRMLEEVTLATNQTKSDFIRGAIRQKASSIKNYIAEEKFASETTDIVEGRSQ